MWRHCGTGLTRVIYDWHMDVLVCVRTAAHACRDNLETARLNEEPICQTWQSVATPYRSIRAALHRWPLKTGKEKSCVSESKDGC